MLSFVSGYVRCGLWCVVGFVFGWVGLVVVVGCLIGCSVFLFSDLKADRLIDRLWIW